MENKTTFKIIIADSPSEIEYLFNRVATVFGKDNKSRKFIEKVKATEHIKDSEKRIEEFMKLWAKSKDYELLIDRRCDKLFITISF